jgi:hypothetical protein
MTASSGFNPAQHPTRRWVDDPDVAVEALFLIRRLEPTARTLVQLLASHPDIAWTEDRLVDADPALTPEVLRRAVARIALLSEALGFVPFVNVSANAYAIAPGTAAMALSALAHPSKAT